MAKTVTLDNVVRGSLRVYQDGTGLHVEASYTVRAGAESVKTVHRDITGLLPPALQTNISNAYNSVFSQVESAELT